MGGLRAVIEKDLAFTLEGDYGMPITLVGPDGTVYSTNILGTPLTGRLIYDHAEVIPDGMTVIVHSPCLTLRASSLTRVPKSGERWQFKVPLTVSNQTVLTSFFLDADRPPVDGKSLGIIRFYLMQATQSLSQILSFAIGAHIGMINQVAKTIAVSGTGSPVTSLVATFGLSIGATAYIGMVPQVSGTTANDFTAPKTYIIQGPDGSTASYVVTVTP